MSSAAASAPPVARKPRYEHYIPRFLLRNYRINELENLGYHGSTAKGKKKKKIRKQDGELRQIEISSGQLMKKRLSKTFGMEDMYSNFSGDATPTNDIEKRLSNLERDASKIIANVCKDFENKESMTTLSRPDKDVLRRFVFLMMYRNKTFQARFSKTRDEYDANDRTTFLEYMQEKGFEQPIQVWFNNIGAFLDVNLDRPDMEWFLELLSQAYPPDALWFFKTLTMSYLAFITPDEASHEFLLTANAYGVFEGPSDPTVWTDWHTFFPISPKLLLIRRSWLLDDDDDSGDLLNLRAMFLDFTIRQHREPSSAPSILADLDIHKANNNYSTIENGQRVATSPELDRNDHVFYFNFFKVPARAVNLINSVFLENSAACDAIVYKDETALRSALDFYLETDIEGFKQVALDDEKDVSSVLSIREQPDEWRTLTRHYLKVLEGVAAALGSQQKLLHMTPKARSLVLLPFLDHATAKRYKHLGGTNAQWPLDWYQATRMMALTARIDNLMQRESPAQKDRIRTARAEFYTQFPKQRVWLLLKIKNRELSFTRPEDFVIPQGSGLGVPGVEDVLANVCHLFDHKPFTRLMQKASNLESYRAKRPDFGMTNNFKFDATGRRKAQEEVNAIFYFGDIAQCGMDSINTLDRSAMNEAYQVTGISAVQNHAVAVGRFVDSIMAYLPQPTGIQKILTARQHREMKIRRILSQDFMDIALNATKLELESLHKVFFEFCFRGQLVVE